MRRLYVLVFANFAKYHFWVERNKTYFLPCTTNFSFCKGFSPHVLKFCQKLPFVEFNIAQTHYAINHLGVIMLE